MSKIMAHRGARNLWAENSALGFRETLRSGFDAVEFDLHLTDAGELLVIHDPTLERTTDASGPVHALTPESRRALRLRGPDGDLIDEGVPSFDEVLDILAPHGVMLYPEIKADPQGRAYPGMVEKVAQTLRARGLQDRAVLHSFDIATVREIRDIAPEFRRMISVDRHWAGRQDGIAAFLGAVEGLVDIVGIHHDLFDAEFDLIRSLRPLAATSVWTVNTPELIRRWIERGPGFIVSDNPVLARELMTEQAPA